MSNRNKVSENNYTKEQENIRLLIKLNSIRNENRSLKIQSKLSASINEIIKNKANWRMKRQQFQSREIFQQNQKLHMNLVKIKQGELLNNNKNEYGLVKSKKNESLGGVKLPRLNSQNPLQKQQSLRIIKRPSWVDR